MTKRLVAALVVALGMLTFAAVASAEPKVDSSQRLQVQVDPNQSGCNTVDSIAGWVTGQDSPSDSNQHLFHTNVGVGGGCVLLFSNASFNRHVAVGNQKNISIQLRTTSVSLGLNYMVAEVSTDGNNATTEDTLFLDPADCNHPVGTSTTWVRADFTGFKGDNSCTIVVNSPETATYSSDAEHSAFQNYALAHPGALVIHKYVVIAAAGDSRFDRIALGAGKMYDNDSSHAVSCTTEASCS
ncbi:MAG: hypothetical protein ACRDQE_13340 [Gaiellales bacterium]